MKFNVFFFCGLLSTSSYATIITCPTAHDIKNQSFLGWLPLYIANEELASQQDTRQFRENVTSFLKAHWGSQYLESGRCFYAGGSITEKMVLAHDAWRPENKNWDWHWLKQQVLAECIQREPAKCPFIL